MAPGSGIHLNRPGASSPDTLSVKGRFLIALDNTDGIGVAQLSNRALQQGRFTGTRGAHQVQRSDATLAEPLPVVLGEVVVLGQDRLANDQTLGDPGLPVYGLR